MDVAVSADGSMATAVWKNGNGTCNDIVTASATIAGNVADWGAPVVLSVCVGGQDTEDPAIALSADGTKAVAVWGFQNPGATSATAQTKSATITGNQGDWASSALVDLQDAGGISPKPAIAVSADGTTAVAAWSTDTGPGRVQSIATKFATINGSDAIWEVAPQYVSGDGVTLASSNEMDIALSADGRTAITNYQQHNGSAQGIFAAAATSTAGATPTDPPTAVWAAQQEVFAQASRFPGVPQIKISADGSKATGVWRTSGGGQFVIQTASASLTGNQAVWASMHPISSVSAQTYPPQLGLSANGERATVAWSHTAIPNPVVKTASATVAGNIADWSEAKVLSAAGANTSPAVGVSADGTQATAIWADRTSSEMFGSSADIDGKDATWGTPAKVSSDSVSSDYAPGIGVSTDGARATGVVIGAGNTSILSASAIRTYRVGFDANGGSGSMSSVTGDAPAPLPANQFARSGHNFAGWNTKADGSGISYANEATYPFRASHTLYAQWVVTPVNPVAQVAVGDCVKDGKRPRVPRSGWRVLTGAKCKTNVGQFVGTRLQIKRVRGDVVSAATLACKVGNRFRKTASIGYGSGYRYCPKGKLVIRTHGVRAKFIVNWFAPAEGDFGAFLTKRTYLN